jgi:hypothetical protein
MLAVFVAGLTILAAGTPASADPQVTPAADAAQAAGTAKQPVKVATADEVVCKQEQVTGSRFPAKVCRRKADADQKRQDDQDRIRQEQRSTGGLRR